MAVQEAHDDVRLGVGDQLVYLKVPNQVLVFAQLRSDVAQVLDRQVLRRGDHDHVVLDAEQHSR